MKIIASLLLVAVALPFSFGAPAAAELIGHWRYSKGNHTYEYSFLEDGTFTGNVARADSLVWVFAGKWSLEGETLSYEFTSSSTDRVKTGAKDQDKLIEVTKEYIVIEARDGSRRKYSRVTE